VVPSRRICKVRVRVRVRVKLRVRVWVRVEVRAGVRARAVQDLQGEPADGGLEPACRLHGVRYPIA